MLAITTPRPVPTPARGTVRWSNQWGPVVRVDPSLSPMDGLMGVELTATVSGKQCRRRGGRSLQSPDHPAGA
jgi:hypothetical protein